MVYIPIYGEFGNGLLLLQPHYIFCKYLMQFYMYDIYIYSYSFVYCIFIKWNESLDRGLAIIRDIIELRAVR